MSVDSKKSFAELGYEGVDLSNQGRFDEALLLFLEMERMKPRDAENLQNIAICLENLNRLDEAERYLEKATKLEPSREDAWSMLGQVFVRRGQIDSALVAYSKAIKLHPKADMLYFARGNAYQAKGDHYSASMDFLQATKIEDSNYQAWNNLGSAYMSLSQNDEAIQALRKTLTFIPTHPIPLTNLVITENRICEWSRKYKHNKLLRKALHEQLAQRRSLVVPFHAFEFNFSSDEHKKNAEMWSRNVEEKVAYLNHFEPGGLNLAGKGSRLRIGYFSGSGFHNSTTTARSMRSQFSMHNRMSVDVYCYAAQRDDGSPVRAAIRRGCDKFVELEGKSHQLMAERIRKDNVNILIDLTGYTMNMQTEVFAIGPSPIQVSFHGFPGTMGAGYIDYLTSDPFTTPPDYAGYYTERLVLLPNTYLTNDHRQSRREVYLNGDDPVHGPKPTRRELGFEENDVILACFNQLYKIEPEVFDVWMRILRRVPSTKLWFLEFTKQGIANLKKSAKKRGVDPSRIISHEQFPREREFRVKGLADFFLDTPLFNAHTTAGDVLWSGVPILTLPGESFVQRVAAGMVKSAGMQWMIARDLLDYEQLAVALVKNKARARGIKMRLEEERDVVPLFDTQLLTEEFERGLLMTWDIHEAVGAAYHIVVNRLSACYNIFPQQRTASL